MPGRGGCAWLDPRARPGRPGGPPRAPPRAGRAWRAPPRDWRAGRTRRGRGRAPVHHGQRLGGAAGLDQQRGVVASQARGAPRFTHDRPGALVGRLGAGSVPTAGPGEPEVGPGPGVSGRGRRGGLPDCLGRAPDLGPGGEREREAEEHQGGQRRARGGGAGAGQQPAKERVGADRRRQEGAEAGQVDPVLDGQVGHRHEGGGRGESHEPEEDPEGGEPLRGTGAVGPLGAEPEPAGDADERHQAGGRGQHRAVRTRARGEGPIEGQGVGPDQQPEVQPLHPQLGEEVGPRAEGGPREARTPSWRGLEGAEVEGGAPGREREERRGEQQGPDGTPAQRAGASLRGGRDHGLVEEEGSWGRDGDGLRAHAQEPGEPAAGPGGHPAPSGPGGRGPVEQRERDEVQEGGEDLGPLRGVGHRFRLDGVEREEPGDDQRDAPWAWVAGSAKEGGDEGERGHHRGEVQEEAHHVVAAGLEPHRPEVEGEGHLGDRPLRPQHLQRGRDANRAGGAQPHVGLDAPPVVEHERPRQRRPVGGGRAGEDGGQQQPRRSANHACAASTGTGWGVKREAGCRSARRAASARPWPPPWTGPRPARPPCASPGRAGSR